MKVKIVDLDELFKEYFERWFLKNSDRLNADEMENQMGELYQQWLSKENSKIGCAPKDYYKGHTASELLEAVDELLSAKKPVCDVLIETIVSKKDAQEVFSALKGAKSEEHRALLMGILSDMESEIAFPLYVYWVKTKDAEHEIVEHAAELLKSNAEAVKEKLLDGADKLDDETRLLICDIVCGCKKDERVFRLLSELFLGGGHTELAAAYLAKYGDSRAIGMLTEYIERDDIDYVEFIEVRNAVEALGGEVNVKKDFTEDKYYRLLRGQEEQER